MTKEPFFTLNEEEFVNMVIVHAFLFLIDSLPMLCTKVPTFKLVDLKMVYEQENCYLKMAWIFTSVS